MDISPAIIFSDIARSGYYKDHTRRRDFYVKMRFYRTGTHLLYRKNINDFVSIPDFVLSFRSLSFFLFFFFPLAKGGRLELYNARIILEVYNRHVYSMTL